MHGAGINAGRKIGTFDVTGCNWSDIGTPLSYARTVIDELRKNGETVYLPPSSDWCKQVELDGYIAIEEKDSPAPVLSLPGRGPAGFDTH